MKSKTKAATVALFGFVALTSVQAQQATKFVTGSAPGGGVDNVARLLAEHMGPLMGRNNIIVDNRPGASYNIAADYVAEACSQSGCMPADRITWV